MRRDLFPLGAAALVTLGGTAFAQDEAPSLSQPPSAAVIADRMAGVADELHQARTGDPVQGEQKAIVRDLDALIASLEKECEACRNGMRRNNPRQGARDSMISQGPGGVGTLIDPDQAAKDWSTLSDRERDRILQSMSEGFPPEYRTVLERYYRCLAEEKPAPAPGPAPETDDDESVGDDQP